MSYAIEPKTVKEFINMDTALPRFQRKQTWGPKDNFKLCISVFKDYPVGVVIINNAEKNWVLDGRQRLNALTSISKSPSEVYKWAQSFIKFKNGDGNDIVTKMYWDTIEDYLSSDFEEDVYKEKDYKEKKDDVSEEKVILVDDDEMTNADEIIDRSFDIKNQKSNLEVLLNYILMMHNIKKSKTKLERVFDFTKVIKKLEYYQVVEGETRFVESKLIKMIKDMIDEAKDNKYPELITEDRFVKHFIEDRYIDEEDTKNLNDFKKIVNTNWPDIKNSFSLDNKVLDSSRIGVIGITKASDLDAQNMFSLVNTGGTLLTAEEILSAKPFWNKPVDNPSKDAQDAVKNLYKILKVEAPQNVVRWDLCATLMSRIDKDGLIFEKYETDSFAQQTTLGFKLLSAIQNGGISSAVVSKLEKNEDFDWNNDYESLITDINNLIDVLSTHDYFKVMKSWKQSLMSITSNTIALEFITIMYKRWDDIGKKTVDSSETKKLKREAVSLIDRLIYEYSNKMWRGSSDSKLASDVNKDNINSRITLISDEMWTALLASLAQGKINDQACTMNLIKPILFHSKYLNKEYPSVTSDKYDLDHIYPQKLFKSNDNLNQFLKDSLINLQILSSSANESKNDKQLSEITDSSIQNEIEKSSYIDKKDFIKYSNIDNIDDMSKLRLKKINEIYTTERSKIINN